MTQPNIAYTGEGIDVFVTSPNDLRLKQYNIVKIGSTGVVLAAATTDVPYGILQNTPNAGEPALVRILGPSKCVSGAGSIVIGSPIAPKADATAQIAVTTQYEVGVALSSAASGDVFTVDVRPQLRVKP